MKEKILYDLIDGISEILKGQLHIIDMSAQYKCDEKEGEYRIYHKEGYCFDVKKEYICDPEEVKQFDNDVNEDGFSYTFFAEWPEFIPMRIDKAISLTQKYNKIAPTIKIAPNQS